VTWRCAPRLSSASPTSAPAASTSRRVRDARSQGKLHSIERRGGVALHVYENSLFLALFALFQFSFSLHALTGASAFNEDQARHGGAAVTTLGFPRDEPLLAGVAPAGRRRARRERGLKPSRSGVASIRAATD
jgi:hypothetical protein